MKLGGIDIDLGHPPTQAWIIVSVGVLIICVGMAISFICRGSVVADVKVNTSLHHASAAHQAYRDRVKP